jgi:hypothetical protein
MSTKIYSSSQAGGKFGIVEQGENIQYEPVPNHSGLVLLVGLLVVGAIVAFILIHI